MKSDGFERLVVPVFSGREDRGDSGADRTGADPQRPVPPDQGEVADAHAGHVGDGVVRTGRIGADGDTEVAGPGTKGGFRHDSSATGSIWSVCGTRAMDVK